MSEDVLLATFEAAAGKVGAEIIHLDSVSEIGDTVCRLADGGIYVADFASARRLGLAAQLKAAGCQVLDGRDRGAAAGAALGLTGANFAIADTGTLVLESTAEDIRLASTLPERHVMLADSRKIVADGLAAVPWLRQLHQRQSRNYLAYITGPSRTADIERVLTIGVHGPRRLHILLLAGLSDDFLEM
ncbi:MAG: lactate utilization protein C [Desulfuromonadales bacterium]